MTPRDAKKRIILPADLSWGNDIRKLAAGIGKDVGLMKIGLQAYIANGPDIVRELRRLGIEVMLDLKIHDIPETDGNAITEAVRLGASITTVHIAAGPKAMQAMVASRDKACADHENVGKPRTKLAGITMLTSIGFDEYAKIRLPGETPKFLDPPMDWDPEARAAVYANMDRKKREYMIDVVVHLAKLGKENGLDGVVCSPQEAAAVRKACGPDFLIITPGVRPAGAKANDQERMGTPGGAWLAGADYLVIGRPITKPEGMTPEEALEAIAQDICDAEKAKKARATLASVEAFTENDHVVLTSGKHSSAYVNHDPLFENGHTTELAEIGGLLAERLVTIGARYGIPGALVGPATGGAILAHEAGKQFRLICDTVPAIPAEKVGDEGKFWLSDSDGDLVRGQRVVIIDDVLTTGKSARHTMLEIKRYGGIVIGLLVVCDRSGKTAEELGLPAVWSLFTLDAPVWAEEDCPLCMRGVRVNTVLGHGDKFMLKKAQTAA